MQKRDWSGSKNDDFWRTYPTERVILLAALRLAAVLGRVQQARALTNSMLRLLETREQRTNRRRGRLSAGGIVVNDPRLFAAIAGLPGLSDEDRHCGGKVCVESGICTGCRGIWYGSTLRLVIELIAALLVRRSGQIVVE